MFSQIVHLESLSRRYSSSSLVAMDLAFVVDQLEQVASYLVEVEDLVHLVV